MTKSTSNNLLIFLTCQHSSSYSSKITPNKSTWIFHPQSYLRKLCFFFLLVGHSSVTWVFNGQVSLENTFWPNLKSQFFNKFARSNNFQNFVLNKQWANMFFFFFSDYCSLCWSTSIYNDWSNGYFVFSRIRPTIIQYYKYLQGIGQESSIYGFARTPNWNMFFGITFFCK